MFSGCCVWIPQYNGAWLAVCDTVTVLLGDVVLLAFEKILALFSWHRKAAFFTTAQISVYSCTKFFTTAQSVHNCTLKKPCSTSYHSTCAGNALREILTQTCEHRSNRVIAEKITTGVLYICLPHKVQSDSTTIKQLNVLLYKEEEGKRLHNCSNWTHEFTQLTLKNN